MNNRGTALWESLPVIAVLLVIVSGSLFLAYVSIGRSWLMYRAEQSLYCVAEEKPPQSCGKAFLVMGKLFLPWGEIYLRKLSPTANGAEVDAEWKVGEFKFRVRRTLDLRSSAMLRSFH